MQTASQNAKQVVPGQKPTFLFLSSCPEPWGGSEELWSSAALRLACSGHRVHALKTLVELDHRRIKELTDAGVTIEDYWNLPTPHATRVVQHLMPGRWKYRRPSPAFKHLCQTIQRLQPTLTVVSMGENFDGLEYCDACQRCNIPYVIISQKASDLHWPSDDQRPYMRRSYFEAKGSYFVSQHNLELTEMQIGARLSNALVVRNPFLTPVEEPLPWPATPEGRLRLACVARMFVLEKGQDVLLRVLAQEKWKARPLEVTFYGKGIHSAGLKEMAELLGIKNVHFAGFTWDVTEIWRTHHGLVLPSRAEGLPLSLIEAMLCGRPAITTAVGGNTEAVDDNVTGFLASGASPQEFDAALERAWQRRAEWESIGGEAARRVRDLIPANPSELFTATLLQVCSRS
jgi:glycosyltransferase involved in cell wall biosynthesis